MAVARAVSAGRNSHSVVASRSNQLAQSMEDGLVDAVA
jgi:hypothetical protein